MAQKTLLAISSIICGLLMIAGGLGYTVNQASRYTDNDSAGGNTPLTTNGQNEDPDVWHPYRPDQEENPVSTNPWDGSQNRYRDDNSSSFFLPALSLLSGAVFAIMGAIALAHRWRGVR
ncbi:MAG: hypothetical protein ACYTG7_01470 [Planctomycetota bacterium]|jgi:hypothetical protein